MNSFKIAFLNVRSLVAHFNEFSDMLSQDEYDLIGVSETWLGPNIPDQTLYINGYQAVRQDRDSRGGGVMFYIKNDLQFSVVFSSASDVLEELWLQIVHSKKTYVVGILYRPPKGKINEFLEIFEERLSDFQPSDVICGGDINLNLLDLSSQYACLFYDYVESFNLQQIIREPTRVTDTTSSLLDIILISSEEVNFSCGVLDASLMSDHSLTYCQFHGYKKYNKYIRFRNLKNVDKELLHEFLLLSPFNDIIYLQNIEEKVAAFNNILLNIFDLLSPVIKVNLKNKRPVWLTYTIKNMINLKNKALKKYQKTKNEINWNSYKQLRNQTNVAIRQEKKQYLQCTINTTCNNSKHFWKKLENLNIHSKKTCLLSIPDSINDPNKINTNFLKYNFNANGIDKNLINFYQLNLKTNPLPQFNFSTVSENTVRDFLFKIKSNATGADQINLDMILLCADVILPFLTNLINSCILDQSFPDQWKVSRIVPLPKKKNVETLSDLRPISILPVLSKIIEKIMNDQIRAHLNKYNILPPNQSGFRPGFSCTTTLLDVTDDIIEATDGGKSTALVLIDYTKAFDTLDHELLLSVLHFVGFSNDAINFMKSYLNSRYQYVETDKGVSSALPLRCGIPQGSILGPLLFSIYTCNITSCLEYCKAHLYADDTQLYVSFFPGEVDEVQNRINEDLCRLVRFSERHNLKINSSKSTFMVFGINKERIKNLMTVKIGTELISPSEKYRNLGLIFDTNLRFKPHINKCLQTAYANLKKLYPHRQLLTIAQKIMLTNSLVLSHFNFADAVYGPCLDKIDKDRIQRVQKSCLRFIYGIRRRQPISHKLKDTGWLSMESRRKLHAGTLFHSIIINNRPSYLTNKIRYRTDVHALNLRYRGYISPPPHRTVYYQRSFSYSIYNIYNKIPNYFKTISVSAFKIKFKSYLLE